MAIPINNVPRRVVYAASGTGPYNFTFEILAATDIAVYRDDTLLTLTTDYTVTINANGTGFVTLTAAPTGATQIAIVGNRTIQRLTDFVTGGDFFANSLNDELDQQTIFAQQNAEGLGRALQAPQTDPVSINMTLPRAADRAGKTLNFDSNGNPVAGLAVVAIATDAVATWLETPSSANLRSAVTDETGTGALVFATSPTLTAPFVTSLTAAGDADTGITFPAADTIAFSEGGQTVMRVESWGGVTINTTTNYSSKFTVKGDTTNGIASAFIAMDSNNFIILKARNDAVVSVYTRLVVNDLNPIFDSSISAKQTAGSTYPVMSVWNNASSGNNIFVNFATESSYTSRGSIDYDRAGGLVRYATTSDYRAKQIIGPIINPGATIDSLKVYEGLMNGATQSRPMLIAHEAQEHAPYAVSGEKDELNDDGSPKMQNIDVSSLVPLLIAEIQSLRARVASLEGAAA